MKGGGAERDKGEGAERDKGEGAERYEMVTLG